MRSARDVRGSLAAKPDEEPHAGAPAERSGEDQQRDERHPYRAVQPGPSRGVDLRRRRADLGDHRLAPVLADRCRREDVERARSAASSFRRTGRGRSDPAPVGPVPISETSSAKTTTASSFQTMTVWSASRNLSMHAGGDAGGVGALHRSAQASPGARRSRAAALPSPRPAPGPPRPPCSSEEAEGRCAGKREREDDEQPTLPSPGYTQGHGAHLRTDVGRSVYRPGWRADVSLSPEADDRTVVGRGNDGRGAALSRRAGSSSRSPPTPSPSQRSVDPKVVKQQCGSPCS